MQDLTRREPSTDMSVCMQAVGQPRQSQEDVEGASKVEQDRWPHAQTGVAVCSQTEAQPQFLGSVQPTIAGANNTVCQDHNTPAG